MSSTSSPPFIVVDSHFRIKYVSGDAADGLSRIMASSVDLLPEIEAFLQAAERADGAPCSAPLADELVLRVARLVGDDGTMFVLSVEEDANRKSLSRAVRRYQLTRREASVLTLILDGLDTGEIAATLTISENTVQGYFKRLLAKTCSRNRVSMVAKILEWTPQTEGVAVDVGVAV